MLHGQRCANRQRSSIALCTAHTRGYHPFRKHTGARGVVCVFSSSLVARVLLTFALLYSHLSPLRSLPLPLPHARAPRTARAFFFPFLFRTSFLSFPLRGGGSSFLAILLLSTFLFPPSPSLFQRAGIVERSLLFKGINDAVRLYRISLPLLPILLVLQ